jgi:hypothetical protein
MSTSRDFDPDPAASRPPELVGVDLDRRDGRDRDYAEDAPGGRDDQGAAFRSLAESRADEAGARARSYSAPVSHAGLLGAWEKVYRAARHMEELQTLLQGVYQDAARTIVLKQETNSGDYGAILPAVPRIPPEASALIGDFVHNLRSSLDHLAFQLVFAAKNRDGGRKTSKRKAHFPIYVHPGRYSDTSLAGADKAARALVKALQPFRDKTHTLWLLDALDSWDERRPLRVVAHDMTPGILDMSLYEQVWLRDPGPAVDNAQLARLRFAPGRQPGSDAGLYISFGLTFRNGPAKGISVRPLLHSADRTVRGILGILADFVAD